MKITMIHGQNHLGSSCHIGRMLAQQLDGEVTEFFLPRDLNHFCLGCYQCVENEEKCPYYTEKHRIMEAVEASDLLIFTTPTYCMHASAPMKSFVDLTFSYWMAHRPRAVMFRKKAVVISTAAGAGTGSAMKDITTTLFYWGVPYVKTYGVSVQASRWEDVKKKEKIQKDIEALARKVEKARVHVGLKTKVVFRVMGMMMKGYDDSSADKQYWLEKGWLGNARPWKDK